MPSLVIGIGNPDRGDDAVGLLVARLVRDRAPAPSLEATRAEAITLMEAWEGSETVVLVDAVSSGAAPGAIHRFDAVAAPLPARLFRYSTHSFGVADAIELARVFGRLPRRLVVYGIEGARFEPGDALSPEVERAAAEVAVRVAGEVAARA